MFPLFFTAFLQQCTEIHVFVYLYYKRAQPRKLKILFAFSLEMYDKGLGFVLLHIYVFI